MSEEKPSSKSLGVKSTSKFEIPEACIQTNLEVTTAERVFGIEEGPTFFPTLEEFLDPLEYIGNIRPMAEKYGQCKIVPPDSWSPPFSLDTEAFHFSTRDNRGVPKQTAGPPDEEYIQELCKFRSKHGQPIHKLPQLDHKPVDLLVLRNEVSLRGGFQKVTLEKKWAEIGRTMNYSRKTCTSLSNSLKTIYSRFVLPFELHMSSHRVDKEPKPSYEEDDSELSSAGPAFDTESDDGLDEDQGLPPLPPQKKRKVKRDSDTESSFPSSPTTPIQNGFPKPEETRSLKSETDTVACEICRKDQNEEALLLCDGCDLGYHMYCLDPPLKVVPKTDWFCPNCIAQVDSTTSETHSRYSLPLFQKKANKFKEEIFSSMRTGDSSKAITENLTEELFWKLVDAGYDDLDVECGSDLSSAQYGSGFPLIERNPREKSALDKWNLNVLPILPDSLFSHVDTNISDIVVPRLNVGMCFSSFSWRYEPHYAYGIDYLHWGDSKTWYCIPASDTEKFDQVVREIIPDLAKQEPDFPYRLTSMISPETLKKHSVQVTGINQRAGQFVVTFPQVRHAEFCHGFNFGEKVNFALSDWPQYGLRYMNQYKALRREPSFSYDGLILSLAASDPSIKTAIWLHAPLKEVVLREVANRNILRNKCKELTETVNQDLTVTPCSYCKDLNYLSMICCSCTCEVVCSEHAEHLCECSLEDRVFRVKYTDDHLLSILKDVTEKAEMPSKWVQKFNESVANLKIPSLNTLKHLLNDAEKIPIFINEAAFLKMFVTRANQWIDKANTFLGKKHRRGSTRGNIPSEEHVRNLFTEVIRLNFHSPEILSLEHLLRVIDTFKAEVRAAFSDPGVTMEQLRHLYQSGISMNVQMDELPQLMDYIQKKEWSELISQDIPTDLSKVEALVETARNHHIDDNDDFLKRLKHLESRGQRWKQSALAILDQDMITSAELEALIELARESPYVPELLSRAESLLARVQDWSLNAKALLERGDNPDVMQRPTVNELHRALDSLGDIPNKPVEVYILEHEKGGIEKWCATVKKTFLKINGQQSWEEILEELQQNLSRCSATETQGESYCLCRSPDSGFMIECDICHEWYHGSCIKFSRKDAKSQRNYICPICNPNVRIPRIYKRPTLDDLYKLIRESNHFKFIPREREVLLSFTDDASSLRLQIRRFFSTANVASPNVDQIKFFLRKVEGMAICLQAETTQLRQMLSVFEPQLNGELDTVTASSESEYSS